jgi:2-keto-4-pentenoate hydratase
MSGIRTAARLLLEARLKNHRLAELPSDARPKTPEEAYACQDALAARIIECYGGTIAGHKIACTNQIAQELLRSGPFHGKLFTSFLTESPARIKANDFFMRVIEAEFAFRMTRDVGPRKEPFTRDEVVDSVEGVLPAIEIVDSRFQDWITAGAESLIADNACHGAWVKGRLVRDWRGIDLAAQEVRLWVNGNVIQTGSGAAVMGDPLNALLWLVEALRARGDGLKAGEYLTTGVTTNIYMGQRGDQIRAEFGQIGTAELTFE